jgi:hypothetical protein
MMNDVNVLQFRQKFDPDFVIGWILGEKSKAYYYRDVATAVLINDKLGSTPVAIWAANNNFHAYIRQVDEQTLTFRAEGSNLIDEETGSTWDVTNGLAIAGPLKGQNLQPVPSSSAFDWAWLGFFPDTDFYTP